MDTVNVKKKTPTNTQRVKSLFRKKTKNIVNKVSDFAMGGRKMHACISFFLPVNVLLFLDSGFIIQIEFH